MFGWTRLLTQWLRRESAPDTAPPHLKQRAHAGNVAQSSRTASKFSAASDAAHNAGSGATDAAALSHSFSTLAVAPTAPPPMASAHAPMPSEDVYGNRHATTHANQPADTPAILHDADLPEVSSDAACRFTAWLLGQADDAPIVAASGLTPAERALLQRLDGVIDADGQPSALLPRAPQVLPQLMKALRNDNYAATEVAARISQDAVLAAEVIRLANNARRSTDDPVSDLEHAVMAIGANNLRRVIATSLLRPMFDVRGTSLSAMAAQQIWADADRKARLCAALASASALDPLDGYLAGLLHNTGWTAALRALDGLGITTVVAPTLLTSAMVQALHTRRDALFGKLVRPWQLSAPVDALADEITAMGLALAQSPLGLSLKTADRLTTLHALHRAGHLPGGMTEALPQFTAVAQRCYREALTG